MLRPNLSYGASGKAVEELQTLLNKKLKEEHRNIYWEDITVNGKFNSHTKEYVRNFQKAAYLLEDGVVGYKTWSALLGTEAFNCFDFPPDYIPAPNKHQCWAGATAMLLNQIGSANTTQPAGVKFEDLGGGVIGGINNSHQNMRKFADAHGMQMFEGENLSCTQICYLVSNNGRLMLDMKGVNSDMKTGKSNDSHFVILAGVRGDGTAAGTTITLKDPSGGTIQTITASFQYLKNKYPKITYQVFCLLNNYSSPIY